MEHITYLPNIKSGDIMCWSACSQTYYAGVFTLMDDTQTYAVIEKPDGGGITMMGQGNAFYAGGENLRIVLSMPESTDLHALTYSNDMVDPKATDVGAMTTVCYEDSTGEDYNDFYFNIASWHSAA